MDKNSALVVDDEPDICELLEITLGRMGINTKSAGSLREARDRLSEQGFSFCLTDMRLPDGNGIELVRYIQEEYPMLPTAVITAHGSMEAAIEALKAGAFDFVSKPVDLEILRNLVRAALKVPVAFPQGGSDRRSRYELLGNSQVMQALRSKIAKLARSQAPVYISGESGTGKELVARLIHEKGPRAERPFVPVNCGAIPEDLMESEFFGHKKGSFTGAASDKDGLFQAAQGGTLFLDEVADLPLPMQVKLLRAIQEKTVRPVGSQQEIAVDVRVLSATHKDLVSMVKEGSFRQDLFYRINVIELRVPALRERPEDIGLLADSIMDRVDYPVGVKKPKLSEDALIQLESYAFPGNVRELENILERAMILCEDEHITPQDLNVPMLDENTLYASMKTFSESGAESLDALLEGIEREAILKALDQTGNNKTAAAQLLGISFRTFRYRVKKLGIGQDDN